MRIGELARSVGVSPDTVRHYERKGLLAPGRTDGGFRTYGHAEQARLRLVRRAMALGFTLDELSNVLKERDAGGAPCRRVRELAIGKLADLDRRIAEASALREELTAIVRTWDERLGNAPEGTPVRLLESLGDERR